MPGKTALDSLLPARRRSRGKRVVAIFFFLGVLAILGYYALARPGSSEEPPPQMVEPGTTTRTQGSYATSAGVRGTYSGTEYQYVR